MSVATEENLLAIIESDAGCYHIRKLLSQGDIAKLYLASSVGKDPETVVLKVAMKAGDNRLLLNEQKVLAGLEYRALPKILDAFELDDHRVVTVFEYIDGLTLFALRNMPRYKKGLTPHCHIGWIAERALSQLGYLHSNMIVHGNLQPHHLLVNGPQHNVSCIDYCFALRDPLPGDYIEVFTDHYSAPETGNKAAPDPRADIYALGKSLVFILGGDPRNGSLPDDVDKRIKAFIKKLIVPDPEKRPNDAWALAREILKLRKEVFGPLTWVEFNT